VKKKKEKKRSFFGLFASKKKIDKSSTEKVEDSKAKERGRSMTVDFSSQGKPIISEEITPTKRAPSPDSKGSAERKKKKLKIKQKKLKKRRKRKKVLLKMIKKKKPKQKPKQKRK